MNRFVARHVNRAEIVFDFDEDFLFAAAKRRRNVRMNSERRLPHVVERARQAACFGEDRLLFGSDWPVATLAATYGEVAHAARALLGTRFGPAAMAKIFGGNATRVYGLPDDGLARSG